MRHTMWAMAVAGLALGDVAMVGGTAMGGEIGSLAVGYGFLVTLAALYLFVGLMIRDRVWRSLSVSILQRART